MLGVAYLAYGAAVHFAGWTGIVMIGMGTGAYWASLFLAKRSRQAAVSNAVRIVGVLFGAILAVLSLAMLITWEDGWFHLGVVASLVTNAIVQASYFRQTREETGWWPSRAFKGP